jgi:hypothetical protein
MKTMLVTLATVALAGLMLVVPASSATAPTAAEAADLQYMREEEKLARDVYEALAAKWPSAAVFDRIAQSEERHMDAVKVVLDRYGITDPAAGKQAGVYTNAELQKLYDTLVARGSQSLQAALAVGVQIETTDIADLQRAIAETANADLDRLYGNLLRGSQNHLRAFTATADGTLPAQGMGPGAGQGQADRRQDGTCTADGQQARRGPGAGSGAGYGALAATSA